MKALFKLTALALLVPVMFTVSCESFDPSELESEIDELQQKTEALENRTSNLESDVQALKNAADGNDYITAVTEIKEGGEVIGYKITFAKADPISIYNGKDGEKGDKGEDGKDAQSGEATSLIASIDLSQAGYATITLSSGESFTIVVKLELGIEFELESDTIFADSVLEIPYTVTGVEEATVIAIAQADWTAAAVAETPTTGKIIAVVGSFFECDELAVLVYANGQTLMRTLKFDEGAFEIAEEAKTLNVSPSSSDIAVTVSTNLDITAACDAEWVSAIDTKAPATEVAFNFHVSANTGAEARSADVNLYFGDKLLETVTLTQEARTQLFDWSNPAAATTTLQDGAALTVLKTAKFCADAEYLYVYMEIGDAKQFGSVADFNIMMDFYIDNDGDPATGGVRSDVFNHGVNWYYETFVGDEATGFTNWGSGQYEYTGADGGSIWSLNNHGGEYPVVTSGLYDADNDFAVLEAKLSRADFKLVNTKAAFGIVLMDGSEAWTAMGKLPQNEDLSMLVVDLPAFAGSQEEQDGIVVDGDFTDWDDENIAALHLQEGAALTVLKTAKFAADEKYLYVYMEIDKAKQFGATATFNAVMDFYIDNDGNAATGGIRSSVFNHGVNWYYETFLGSEDLGFSTWGSGQYEYIGEDGGSIWNLNNHGGEYPVMTYGVYDAENDLGKVEARLSRADFKLTNTTAAFGIVLMDGDESWNPMGKLPQNEDLSMFVMELPAYSAE